MADRVQSYKVICGGGLNSNENHLDLSENSPGAATRLVNYEVSLFGGYRRIEGFTPYNANANHQEVDPANTEGKILSVSIHKDDNTDSTIVIVSRKVKKFTYTATAGQTVFSGADSNSRTLANNNTANTIIKKTSGGTTTTLTGATLDATSVTLSSGVLAGDIIEVDTSEYKFYRYVPFAAWAVYTTGITHKFKDGVRQVKKLRHVSFNFGDGNKICFVDGVNNAIVFDGTNWKAINPSNSGGNSSPGGASALARPELVDAFENHLFLGGDRVAQATIAYSAPLEPLTFTAAAGAG